MKILDEAMLARYQRFAKLWWAGWVLAGAALLGTAWALGRAAAFDEAIVEVGVMSDNVDRLRHNNELYLADLKRFEEHQDAQGNAILELGGYLRERQDQINWNRRAVVDLTKRRRR